MLGPLWQRCATTGATPPPLATLPLSSPRTGECAHEARFFALCMRYLRCLSSRCRGGYYTLRTQPTCMTVLTLANTACKHGVGTHYRPGAAREQVDAVCGGTCVFVLGACGETMPAQGHQGDPAVTDRDGQKVLACRASFFRPRVDSYPSCTSFHLSLLSLFFFSVSLSLSLSLAHSLHPLIACICVFRRAHAFTNMLPILCHGRSFYTAPAPPYVGVFGSRWGVIPLCMPLHLGTKVGLATAAAIVGLPAPGTQLEYSGPIVSGAVIGTWTPGNHPWP